MSEIAAKEGSQQPADIASNEYSEVLKLTNKSIIQLKHFWIIAEILGSVLVASFFFMMTIWLMNIDYSGFLHAHTDNVKEETNPSIVWYNTQIVIKLNKKITCSNGSNVIKCDVFLRQSQPENPDAYLFYAPYLKKFPLPRRSDVIWGLFSDETPINNQIFMIEKALNLFNFSATFSRYSDVPFPLFTMGQMDLLTSTRYYTKTEKKNSYLSTLAPIVYIQSSIYTSTDRDGFVQELMQHFPVDAYGYSLQNKRLPINKIYTDPLRVRWDLYKEFLYDPELLYFLGRYKFMVTIENAVCNDYVSEKIWRSLHVGVVPIYFGSPLIRDWLPNNKSAILVQDYPTPEALIKHLQYLLQNDTAYDEYLKHKTSGLITNQKLVDEITTRPYQNNFTKIVETFECFICKKVHSRNNSEVNMMRKKDYDCPPAISALAPFEISFNPFFDWQTQEGMWKLDKIYEEFQDPDPTPRESQSSFR